MPTQQMMKAASIKTKVICTIGPKTQSKEMLKELVIAGMNVMRLNFSHGSHEYHRTTIKNLREALKEMGGDRIVAILLDTKGPEIRTGKLKDGKEIELQSGQKFTFYCDDAGRIGDERGVATTYPSLPRSVKVGDPIMVDDGLLQFKVIELGESWVRCKLENCGCLGETKGINLPGNIVNLPALTEKDRQDILFGIEEDVDIVAASFVRRSSDVLEIRELLGDSGIKIVSKIENQEGLDNFDSILMVSDGIMVARGDLGVEIPVEQVVRAQKMMIKKCNAVGKPCITATQMLESMIFNPRPTRAEATDVENAVLDGSDCVMLSGESAKGAYPIKAVEMMVKLCRAAEEDISYGELYAGLRKQIRLPIPVNEAIASSAVKTAWDVQAACIVALTETGNMARALAKYRPIPPVIAIASSQKVARQLQISRGIHPIVPEESATGNCSDKACSHSDLVKCCPNNRVRDQVAFAMRVALQQQMALPGDPIVLTSGVIEGQSGSTNLMRVFKCIQ